MAYTNKKKLNFSLLYAGLYILGYVQQFRWLLCHIETAK